MTYKGSNDPINKDPQEYIENLTYVCRYIICQPGADWNGWIGFQYFRTSWFVINRIKKNNVRHSSGGKGSDILKC